MYPLTDQYEFDVLNSFTPPLPPQVSYLNVEPTHPFFWQEVARHVAGRTAAECFTRVFDAQKSPEERARLPRRRNALLKEEPRLKLAAGEAWPGVAGLMGFLCVELVPDRPGACELFVFGYPAPWQCAA